MACIAERSTSRHCCYQQQHERWTFSRSNLVCWYPQTSYCDGGVHGNDGAAGPWQGRKNEGSRVGELELKK